MISRLKELREKKGLSQEELGKMVNVSRQAILAIEKGKYDPSLWLAYNLSRVFNIPIEDLFDFEGSKRG